MKFGREEFGFCCNAQFWQILSRVENSISLQSIMLNSMKLCRVAPRKHKQLGLPLTFLRCKAITNPSKESILVWNWECLNGEGGFLEPKSDQKSFFKEQLQTVLTSDSFYSINQFFCDYEEFQYKNDANCERKREEATCSEEEYKMDGGQGW